MFPCVFGLLPHKTEATYTRFFRELFIRLENLGNRNPDDTLVDFERAAINSIHNLNPQIEVKCCFHYFSSNVWKRIQHVGLQQRYSNDQELALHLRMLCAIAFLPTADVIQGFEELVHEMRNIYKNEVDELLDYFEEDRFRRNAPRRPPSFALDFWNMFIRTDDELPRTNSSVDGWHRSFQGHVSSCHPVFWKFLNILRDEENLICVSIIQHLAGHPPPPHREHYLDCNRGILDDFPNFQTLHYLRSITHNLQF